MLSAAEIVRYLKNPEPGKRIVIDPFQEERLNPNSYDLTLHHKLLVYHVEGNLHRLRAFYKSLQGRYETAIPGAEDLYALEVMSKTCSRQYLTTARKDDAPVVALHIPVSGLVLCPGVLYLASTQEYTETEGFVPVIYGKSTLGRLGLTIHQTAGFGDNGFRGHWTLELHAIHPVVVYAGMKICQICYEPLHGDSSRLYNGRYQDQLEVTPALVEKQ